MEDKILEYLKSADGYISGQQLCEILGVSRTAVWKAVGRLRNEGYEIDAVKNRGYRLTGLPDLVTDTEIKDALDTSWAGHPVFYKEEMESTNDTAKRMASEGAGHGTLVVTERQTGGRGRLGRSWDSPEGSGIWMSIILKPDIAPERASMLTLVAALAVYDSLSVRVSGCGIKWPNDILIGSRKVCGILTEMSAEFDAVHDVVIGIGINVNTEEFPEDIKDVASSMYLAAGKRFERCGIIADIWKAFEKYYEIFMQTADLSGLKDLYNERLINRGRRVRIRGVQEASGPVTGTGKALSVQGTAKGIDDRGNLVTETDDGRTISVFSGEVSVRGYLGYV